MRDVAVVAYGLTKFGKHGGSVVDLLSEAGYRALQDATSSVSEVDALLVGNMSSGEFEGRSGIANAVVSELALEPAFASKVENTSGSGGAAFLLGWSGVASGFYDLVLVMGGEVMTVVSREEATDIIASLTHPVEYAQGISLPGYAGLMARAYQHRYDAPREAMAHVAVKNHYNGARNPNAQFQKEITLEKALESPMIADPLRLYDFCPITDGAAAVLLCPYEAADSYTEKPVLVRGVAGATDTHVVHEREDLTAMRAVRVAAERAYAMGGLGPEQVDVAEVHDMATILEIVQTEELGFFRRGEGWKAAMEGATSLEGLKPVNTSGGLKAKGHPLGATGVAQVAEVTAQLQGRAGARQVSASKGLACNVAGFGNSAIITLLEAGE
ncbi:MAG: thiolase family protein [Candidatus Thermoplasmatota archaeon]|nr:thiolase family protein [Candidatus Thermoplasmatota archaeon]